MDFSIQEAFDSAQNFSSKDNDRGGSITDFFILGSGEFNHALGSRVGHIDLKRVRNRIELLL